MDACDLNNLYFFFNDTATTEIYTLSLHDALPILAEAMAADHDLALLALWAEPAMAHAAFLSGAEGAVVLDRKSTRLNSSHANISYAVFCLKKKANRS